VDIPIIRTLTYDILAAIVIIALVMAITGIASGGNINNIVGGEH
jgi:hypothetical protein